MNGADPTLAPEVPDVPDAPAATPPDAPEPTPSRGYQYKHGDRPLDGYTIERAAGRGGFGEVYYAVSDGGREVALKVIHTFEQIELRGISHCMNLKSPHLVTVFDVKYGNDGRPWVVMEFVAGPSLKELIDASPTGLGPQKAAFFLREIGKGLTYLHDCGIVHRDLKPGNIFFESGYVKIGDYGLSKAISPGRHTGQTVTVGTVHYMAPEIGQGRYDKGIDVYALGALLYEMLTGQVPFLGSSAAEVLMKHLSTDVDLSGVAEPFATVIRRAMAKDPAQRYASVQEMVEAVFGAEHVRNSVSHFSPDSLTIVAGRAVRRAGGGSGAAGGLGSFTPSDPPGAAGQAGASGERARRSEWGPWAEWGDRCGRLGRLFAPAEAQARGPQAAGGPNTPRGGFSSSGEDDPIPAGARRALTAVTIILAAGATGAIGGMDGEPAWLGVFALLAITGATLASTAARRWLWPVVRDDSRFLRCLAVGGPAAAGAMVFSFPVWASAHHREFPDAHRTLAALVLCLLATNWEANQALDRPQRIKLSRVLLPAALALVLGLIFGADVPAVVGVVAGTMLAVQVLSPWSPAAARRLEERIVELGLNAPGSPVIPAGPAAPAAAPGPFPAARPVVPPPVPAAPPASSPASSAAASPPQIPPQPPAGDLPPPRLVPKTIRVLWLSGFALTAGIGLFLLGLFAVDNNPELRHVQFVNATGFLTAAFFCFRRGTVTRYAGIWPYLLRPLVHFACVVSIACSLSAVVTGAVDEYNTAPVLFFLICPVVVLVTLHLLLPRLVESPGGALPGGVMSAYPHAGPAGAFAAEGAAPPHARPEQADFSVGDFLASLGRFTLTALASVLLLAAVLAALAVAADVPGFFDAPWVDPQIHREMRHTFGAADWPRLFRDAGAVLSFLLAAGATLLLLIARRPRGAHHMARAVLGVALLLGAVASLGRALPAWTELPGSINAWELADQFAARIHGPHAAGAAGMAVVALFLLLVPAGRRERRRELEVARETGETSDTGKGLPEEMNG